LEFVYKSTPAQVSKFYLDQDKPSLVNFAQ
jgi:hypothetical protein